jgi:acetyl esterase
MTSVIKKIEEFFHPSSDPMSKLDGDMKKVLDALAALHPKPIESCTPEEARRQPLPVNAVHEVMLKDGQHPSDDMGVRAVDITFTGAKGNLPARLYRPEKSDDKVLPVVLYFHGGGWVIADIDAYDGGARAISKQTGAIVISAHYRQAPEHKFPAAHDDAFAAYKWVLDNATSFGGDPKRIAIMGESAGGNLAITTAIAARDAGLPLPLYQVLVYPVAGIDMTTESYRENANAKPLNKAMMGWFMKHILPNGQAKQDSRLDIIGKASLEGLPPATIITADIDPLRSDGQMLAKKLKDAGIAVNVKNYEGVTHEFFGMGTVVGKAKDAEALAAKDLKNALNQ